MNYIIKGVLKKIFTQYLYIKDDGLDLQSGIIKLPSGLINHDRINEKLKPLKMKITSSSYKNLIIHVPIMEILSKPIKISIQVLDVMVERLYEDEEDAQKQNESEAEQSMKVLTPSSEVKMQKSESEVSVDIRQNSGYFRNIINRLLYNMQIFMEKINIKMLDSRQQEQYRQAFLMLSGMSLKNSLIILEANIIRKTLNLQLFHVKHLFGGVEVRDVNVCVDFSNKKLGLIAIIGKFKFEILKVPVKKMVRKISKKISQKQIKSQKKLQQKQKNPLELNIFMKVNSTKLSSKILELEMGHLQSTIKKSSTSTEIKLNFDEIKLKNCFSQNQQDSHLLKICYLPLSTYIKIYSEFEDNIIINSFIEVKKQNQADGKIDVKMYHLMVSLNCNQGKLLLDHLLNYERQIQKLSKLIKRNSTQNKLESEGDVDRDIPRINALAYRLLLQIQYEHIQLKTFGTATLSTVTKEQTLSSTLLQLNKKKSKYKKSQQEPIEHEHDHNKLCHKIKVLQFGVSIAHYNVCSVNQLEMIYNRDQILANCCGFVVEVSLKLADTIKDNVKLFQRDLAYYQEKFKHFIAPEKQESQPKEEQQPEEDKRQKPIMQKKLPKIYLKMNQILLKLGELSTRQLFTQQKQPKKQQPSEQPTFISILEVQLINILFSLITKKLKLKTDMISHIYSPYTLQKNPLTNELQFSIIHNLQTKELNINLRNNFIVLIQDRYVNIVYKLFDKDAVWCKFRNLTNQKIKFIQETDKFQPLLGREDRSENEMFQPEGQSQTYYHKIRIDSFKQSQLFWLHETDFKLSLKGRQTPYISLHKSQELQFVQSSQLFQQTRQLLYEDESQTGFILKLLYNKLGNLCQIVFDHKCHIVSYSQPYKICINGGCFNVPVDTDYAIGTTSNRKWQGNWMHKLEDLAQDLQSVELILQEKEHWIDQLMTNEQFTLFGIIDKDNQSMAKKKIYSSYILQNTVKKMINFTVMPFLIIKNELSYDIAIEIVEKKSQNKQQFVLQKGQQKQLNNNQHFDYYMKQFIIKLSLNDQKGNYQSDSFYFNTFIMVDQQTQNIIQLRSTQKQNYHKRSIIFEEGLLLKTKLITIKNSLRLVNKSDFGFSFRVKATNRDALCDQLFVESHQQKEWCCRMKKDTLVQILLINQVQNKIEVPYGELRQQKILSFNFCKIQDKYYNMLFKIHTRTLDGYELLQIQNFIQIINLCHYVGQLSIQQSPPLKLNQKGCLFLNSTSLNKYNNKVVEIDDMNKIYAEMFLTSKVTDHPLRIHIDSNTLVFSELIKKNNQELVLNNHRYVLTLLKDMNYNRITFYLTDRLYNQKMSYTIFNNTTPQHFLLSDDSEYSHHFIIEEQDDVKEQPLEKVFINSHSFNCLINKDNYDILLCDAQQKHLEKVDKKLLNRQGIKFQQYQFDQITLIDCNQQEKNDSQQIRRQISTKGIQIHIKLFRKIQMTVNIKNITLRFLQTNKFDCLVEDISVKNQQTKDYLLRIPEQMYLLFQGKIFNQAHFILLKNVFIKCKNVIVNVKRQMPYAIIGLLSQLGERMGFGGIGAEQNQHVSAKQVRERVKKLNGEAKLKQYINQMLFLIKNVFIHEVHLSLTIQLQNLSFSNVIILPQYELSNKFMRQKNFKNEITTFYLTNLLAKFPKLSFLMSNFKNPWNTLKLFMNIRDAMKQKVEVERVICFKHEELPDNPFVFSLQRWNHICNYLGRKNEEVLERVGEKLMGFIYQNRKYLILTNYHLLWLDDQEFQKQKLTNLQSIRIIKNRANSQIIIRFKNTQKISLLQDQKKCLAMLNNISQLLL